MGKRKQGNTGGCRYSVPLQPIRRGKGEEAGKRFEDDYLRRSRHAPPPPFPRGLRRYPTNRFLWRQMKKNSARETEVEETIFSCHFDARALGARG